MMDAAYRYSATDLRDVLSLASTAYMHDFYPEASWQEVAKFLLRHGHTIAEAGAIMRSKHMRWADDSEGAGNGNHTTSAAFVRYYNKAISRDGMDWLAEGRAVVREMSR